MPSGDVKSTVLTCRNDIVGTALMKHSTPLRVHTKCNALKFHFYRFAVWPKLESLNIVGNPIESKYLNQFLEEWKFFGVKIDVIDSNIQSEGRCTLHISHKIRRKNSHQQNWMRKKMWKLFYIFSLK